MFLTAKETNPRFSGGIRWNFDKFLFARDGKILARFHPKTKPESEEFIRAVEDALGDLP
jgi:glutathione peroxidase